ncbi:hypothetical protein TCSYLVIO_005904 [Trypanosoma cruzi]|nr:hypothetical protein TCSYLVIO_005904 [Trypanosoma cruzi]
MESFIGAALLSGDVEQNPAPVCRGLRGNAAGLTLAMPCRWGSLNVGFRRLARDFGCCEDGGRTCPSCNNFKKRQNEERVGKASGTRPPPKKKKQPRRPEAERQKRTDSHTRAPRRLPSAFSPARLVRCPSAATKYEANAARASWCSSARGRSSATTAPRPAGSPLVREAPAPIVARNASPYGGLRPAAAVFSADPRTAFQHRSPGGRLSVGPRPSPPRPPPTTPARPRPEAGRHAPPIRYKTFLPMNPDDAQKKRGKKMKENKVAQTMRRSKKEKKAGARAECSCLRSPLRRRRWRMSESCQMQQKQHQGPPTAAIATKTLCTVRRGTDGLGLLLLSALAPLEAGLRADGAKRVWVI